MTFSVAMTMMIAPDNTNTDDVFTSVDIKCPNLPKTLLNQRAFAAFEPFMLLVSAVTVLNYGSSFPAFPEPLLGVVTPEL